jgi:hypothetical protein
MNQLQALMRLKPTAEDCAAFFQCSVDTIERRIKEYTTTDELPDGLSFAEFREQNMVHTRFSLIRTALKKADSGDNTMLIFSLKNLCGWRDKQPGEEDKIVVNNFPNESKEDLEQRARELATQLLSDDVQGD